MNTSNRILRLLFIAALAALFFLPQARAQDAKALTLREAVSLAVQNSPELAMARVRYGVSQDRAGLARSEFRPNLYTGTGVAYTRGLPSTPNGKLPSLFSLSYLQKLYDGPALGEIRAADKRSEIERLAIDQARDAAIVRAASLYIELSKVRRTRELLENERTSAQRVVEITSQRASEGLELPSEVTRAELTLARVEQRRVQFEGREEGLENELRGLTGMPQGTRIELTAEELPFGPDQRVAELIHLAETNSIELKQAELEQAARAEKLRGERAGYWPSFRLVGQYDILSRFNNFEDFYNKFERHNLTVGVQIDIPIFSSQTRKSVALARSQLNEAELEVRKKRNDLDIQVRQQERQVRSSSADREVARLELKLAQEDLRALQARFDEGKASLRDLEKARLDESLTWQAFLDADVGQQKTRLELLRMTGQLSRVFP